MTEIPIEPKLFWGLFYLLCFGLAVGFVYVLLSTRKPSDKDPLDQLKSKFGASSFNDGLFLFAVLLWAAIALSLTVGLLGMIWELIWFAFPTSADVSATVQKEQTMEFRIALVRLTAFTATLGAVIALPFTVIRLRLASEQNQTAAEGHITDRISKAVEGLGAEKVTNRIGRYQHIQIDGHGPIETRIHWQGEPQQTDELEEIKDYGNFETITQTKPNLEVRIGAIYSLERIAQDSERDHIQVMEILCAYVRENSQESGATDLDEKPNIGTPLTWERLNGGTEPRIDIQTAITVIGRRDGTRVELENRKKFRISLRKTNLQNTTFTGNWSKKDFTSSRLEQANFSTAVCIGVNFDHCHLTKTKWSEVKTQGHSLKKAKFRHSRFGGAVGIPPQLLECENLACSFYGCEFNGITFES